MATQRNKQQTTPEQTGTNKAKPAKSPKDKTTTQTPEQKKAAKEVEREIKKAKFYKQRSEIGNEIKEDLKQTLIIQQTKNDKFKNTTYTPERKKQAFEAIIYEMERGESLTNALNKCRVNARYFYEWIESDITMHKRYAHAHTKRADALFDRLIDVAVNMPDVNRARLVVDTTKYVCARISPEKYSEKQTINIIGNLNQTINQETPEDREKRILKLFEKAQGIIDITPQ